MGGLDRGKDGTLQAPGAFADVVALREAWRPVAFGRDLADRPAHADPRSIAKKR
jgi:hypothetical protein